VDATKMPFEPGSVRFIGMLNTLHHIPDPEAFFREAVRVLKPGARLMISDQHRGWISRFVLKHLHHEAFDDRAIDWKFPSQGPLSSANGAMAWMIFIRDRVRFEKLFPELRIIGVKPHTPFRYWLSGGLKTWTLLPPGTWSLATAWDRFLTFLSPQWGSFLDIELERIHVPNR
jgi:SAM-dependent methyltransferase